MKRAALILAALFVLLNTINTLNKGGDAAVFFEGGRRLLAAENLYQGSSAADGFIGPPFQALFFAPFAAIAALNLTLAKLAWYALNLICLWIGIAVSARTLALAELRGVAGAPLTSVAILPLAAVLLPLQTNFEHQNMNALLLALIAGATHFLALGSPVGAGILIGSATALKAFPALLIVYLAARRYWRACAAAIATTIVLTAMPLIVYGAEQFAQLLSTWFSIGRSGWPIRGNNQSLVAAIDRFTGAFGESGVRTAADAPVATLLFGALALILVIAAAWVIFTTDRSTETVQMEIAAITALAILLAPIAWDHYWLLLFPAFLVIDNTTALSRTTSRRLFWIAAILTTGLSTLTVGRAGFDLARQLSASTLAALILYGALLISRRSISRTAEPAR